MARRAFALLLLTPLLANCTDAATPVAPSDPVAPSVRLDESPGGEWGPSFGDWELAPGESQPDESSPLQVAHATGAVMTFGNPDAGTAFTPPGSHDQSFHARDRVNPGAVVIDAGQKVTFQVYPGHRVAIYKPGTKPDDIAVTTGTFVLDPTNRLAIQSAPVPVLSFTFHNPGKYLVICAFTRHFVDANMWAWVIVR